MSARAKRGAVRGVAMEYAPRMFIADTEAALVNGRDYRCLIVPDEPCAHDWRAVGNYNRERWCRECGEYQHRAGVRPWTATKPRRLRVRRRA